MSHSIKTMISSGTRNIIRLLFVLLMLHVIVAFYDTPNIRPYPSVSNNQRSADSGYKYAWFTRDIHDDEGNNVQEDRLSPQELIRLKMLKNILNRKYSINDENLSK